MIKCDKGDVEIKGSKERVAVEFACIVSSVFGIFENRFGKEEADELITAALAIAAEMMGEVRNELQH